MTAARAFGMKGADAAPADRRDGVLDEARLVQRVGMDRHLRVGGVGYVQAIADRGGCRAPILVQLQADHAGVDLLVQCVRQAGVALAQKAEVHRKRVSCLEHAFDVPRAGRRGRREGAGRGAGAAAEHGCHAGCQRLFDLLRRDEMDVAVDAARRHNAAFATDDFGAWPDHDVDARLHVRIARLANGDDAAALQPDVGLDDAPVVEDQRVGHHRVDGAFGS